MTFVLQIIDLFKIEGGLDVELSSGAPAGSGLGGSSAMGIVLHSALAELTGESYSIADTVLRVKGVEGRILNQGVPGYQDYYPALTGGILALKGEPGKILYEQLYSKELASFLESHITLVYSGISRDSGINNWDVYKRFFDGDEKTRTCLQTIADLSYRSYQAITDKHYDSLLELIHLEGQARKDLAPNIVPQGILDFYHELEKKCTRVGMKMCGAGGGGCFILTHTPDQKETIQKVIDQYKMQILDFEILPAKDNA
jgi:D-glycero-alpha-D-manno-heptose-7-phosphate kinase